jgi:hypothetical protein
MKFKKISAKSMVSSNSNSILDVNILPKLAIPFIKMIPNFPKKTKSMCQFCGKMGHKATDCWDHPNKKDNLRSSRFQKRNDQSWTHHRTNFRLPNHSSNQASANTTNTDKPTWTYCNELNHTEAACFKKQADLRNKSNNQTNPNEAADVILVAAPMELWARHHSETLWHNFYWWFWRYLPHAILFCWYVQPKALPNYF